MAGSNQIPQAVSNHVNKAGAEIRASSGHWFDMVAGALLTPAVSLDAIMAYHIGAIQFRDPMTGVLSTSGMIGAVVFATATALVIAVSVHAMLRQLPDRAWARGALWLGAVALIVSLSQAWLAALSDPTLGFTTAGDTEAVAFMALLVRSPIYVLAAVTSGIGLTMLERALKTRDHVRQLKQDMVVGVTSMTEIAEGRQLARSLKAKLDAYNQHLTDVATDLIHNGLQAEADRLDSYQMVGMGVLTEDTWSRLIETAVSAPDPGSPELIRVVKSAVPRPFPLHTLPNDPKELSQAASAELTAYSAWLRQMNRHSIRSAITKES